MRKCHPGERDTIEKTPAMLTVYHPDGDRLVYHFHCNRLVLTHYNAADNQPHMLAKSHNPGPVELEFRSSM